MGTSQMEHRLGKSRGSAIPGWFRLHCGSRSNLRVRARTEIMRLKRILLCLALLACTMYASERPQRAITHTEDPEYPALAKKMDLHGTVKLKIWIKPDGTV